MMAQEKYRLNWKEFEDNTKVYFRDLRVNEEFSDVTLACEDGQQMDAHKVVLSACSPFFQALLRRNQHQHPLIYMRGMKSVDLAALLDFMYFGEIEISQEDLPDFLAMAEELKLKGLTPDINGAGGGGGGDPTNQYLTPEMRKKRRLMSPEPNQREISGTPEHYVCEPDPYSHMQPIMVVDDDDDPEPEVIEEESCVSPPGVNNAVALMGHCEPEENIDYRNSSYETRNSNKDKIELDRSFDPEAAREAVTQLENKVQSMILRQGDGTWQCRVCGKSIQGRQAKGNMKQHVETHIEGISHTCTTCGKSYKNRNSLHTHISMKHRSTTPDSRYKRLTGRKIYDDFGNYETDRDVLQIEHHPYLDY